jgi:hypothetical protein
MFITVHMFGPKEFYVLTVQSCPIKHPKILVISTASQLALMPLHHMKTTHWRPLIPGLQLQPYIQNIVGCSPGIKKTKNSTLQKPTIFQPPTSKRSALPWVAHKRCATWRGCNQACCLRNSGFPRTCPEAGAETHGVASSPGPWVRDQ